MITITPITHLEPASPHLAAMVAVYGAAFAQPPYHEPAEIAERFRGQLLRHAGYPGFTACLAVAEQQCVGFAYGTANVPGQWWHERVAPALTDAQCATWFDGAFVLTELAVHPTAQGRGIGSRLHDALLAAVPFPTAVLSVRRDAVAALAFYRRHDWQTVLPDFVFPGGSMSYQVLARTISVSIGAPCSEAPDE